MFTSTIFDNFNIFYRGDKIISIPLFYDNITRNHFINEDEYLDLYNVENELELLEYIENSKFMYRFNVFKNITSIQEATLLQIPIDRDRDIPDLSYQDSIKQINRIPHVDIYLFPQLDRGKDKYSSCFVFVKNPHPEDGVNYIPIIIHTSGGVSVHPSYSKYFKRSFSSRERHLILGFLYIYGNSISWACNLAAKNGNEEIDEFDAKWLKLYAMSHKDNDAPRRIDQGTPRELRKYYKASVDDYIDWKNSLPK